MMVKLVNKELSWQNKRVTWSSKGQVTIDRFIIICLFTESDEFSHRKLSNITVTILMPTMYAVNHLSKPRQVTMVTKVNCVQQNMDEERVFNENGTMRPTWMWVTSVTPFFHLANTSQHKQNLMYHKHLHTTEHGIIHLNKNIPRDRPRSFCHCKQCTRLQVASMVQQNKEQSWS